MPEALSRTLVKINGFSLHRPRIAPVFVAIVLVSLLSLVFVWSRIHAINLEYNISGLEKEIRLGQQQIKQLKLEAAYLSRDTRIEGLARKELGLRPPASGQIIRID
ncbi:MAG: cell division protein FtsL [Desulfuromonadales bacterium]|nr:cell division protein FtsL [Desulfuromonadales bacterium]